MSVQTEILKALQTILQEDPSIVRGFSTTKRGEIVKETLVVDDPSKTIDADAVMFLNQGQTICWIDDQIALLPGEIFIDKNVRHDYSFAFFTMPSPPTVSKPQVYAGNMLRIRRYLGADSVPDYIRNPGAVSASVTFPAYSVRNPTETINNTTADFNIPAGQIRVYLENVSPKNEGAVAIATVNGNPITPGQKFEFQGWVAEVGKEDNLSRALSIVTNGASIEYYYY